MEIYTVKEGDTLYSIASHYGISVDRLIYDNQLNTDGILAEGQALLILIPKLIHRVKHGQSVTSIAASYDVPVKQIYQNNPYLLNQKYITEGDFIVISYTGEPSLNLKSTGYAYPYIRKDILREALLYLDELRIFSYGFNENGNLIPPVNEDPILTETKDFGVSPVLVLTPLSAEGTFNNQLVKVLVENKDAQEQLANELLEVMRSKGYEGVDVDFEYILAENREGYAEFISYLSEKLSVEGFRVSVSLAPKISADQPGVLYEGVDYQLLGEAADSVFLMTYEWGYT
ncbi:LysM peptidoglycan-binding domain-containing protein [Blautia liquoris]|uniref:LysM peptidoglycan-binding domain-containing protein n=1 Tax=Blautia liquoris TaxID=2779518 RepID=A0A7M2RJ99_9FIRM|nr:LysM peptidoglycan-binding domain-containing protein [Blautia liquoris]QOV20208.1 LysM peptidoglycan-binding domain-containing protein [Blautia liquoris]